MPQLYIPEIGDEFELTKPWSFILHQEHRNDDLWSALDADNHALLKPFLAIREPALAEIKEIEARMVEKTETYRSNFGYGFGDGTRTRTFKDYATKEDKARYDELRTIAWGWNDSYIGWDGEPMGWNDRRIPVTFPKGTQLKVDRIYIRKGASDFSSLSFYVIASSIAAIMPVENQKGFKKGKKRFWAKLADVNKIFATVKS